MIHVARQPASINISLNGTCLAQKEDFKYLGVFFTQLNDQDGRISFLGPPIVLDGMPWSRACRYFASLSRSGRLDIVRQPYNALAEAFASGALKADVVLIQLAAPLPGRPPSFGLANDYLVAAAPQAHAADPAPAPKPIVAATVNLGRPVDFEKDVYPILELNCIACHNQGTAESRLNLETPEAIRKGGKRGPAVVPLARGAGGLKKDSFAICYQVTTLGKEKLDRKIGTLEADEIVRVEEGLLAAFAIEIPRQ